MLNKKNRIGNRDVIEKLFNKGKLFKNHFLVFKYDESSSGTSQFAVSVSKKIQKKAVKRNHLRRQVYESLRTNLGQLDQNIVALVIARPPCEKAGYQELNQSIVKFFNSIESNEKATK